MFKVFVADKLAASGLTVLEDYAELEVDFAPGLALPEACAHARDADAIVVRSETKVKGELLEAAAKLRIVGRAGIGVDNIDLNAATERGIVVVNTPDANATTTAELAVAHIFSLSRHLPQADSSVRHGRWERAKFVGSEISGKTVGIIGFGTIGRLVAERCRSLRMRVLAHDPFVAPATFEELGVARSELEPLLENADYISLHCPLTEETRNFLNAERLAQMKKGARIVNCARGGLIDEQALLEAIRNAHLAGAALDVFAQEPPLVSPLFEEPRIHFTPHLGASTQEAQTAVGVEIAHQIAAFLIRGEIKNAVNVPSIAPQKLAVLGPYMDLARRLGRFMSMMLEHPLDAVEFGLFGRAAELECHPIASEALIGLLEQHMSARVNRINAAHIARRQGLKITESVSPDSRDYLSLLRIRGTSGRHELCLEGTLFDERRPRLVRVNDYHVEAELAGQMVVTHHADRPGVIGAIGDILGGAGINIARMQVGAADGQDTAIGLLGVSRALDAATLSKIGALDAVTKALQVSFST